MSVQPTLGSHMRRAVHDEATGIARRLRNAAERARGNEEQLRMACDELFGDFAHRAGVRWEPEGERRVAWLEEGDLRRGRIDRLFNRVVVEYEAPGALYATNEAATNRKALDQVRNYMAGLIQQEGWTERSVAGVVTDGLHFVFCRFSAGHWVEEAPLATDAVSVGRFLRLLLTFHRPPLLPDPLVERFGAQSDVTAAAIRALYTALQHPTNPLTDALFAQWEDFFADIAGLDPVALEHKRGLKDFARRIAPDDSILAAGLLFALYTYSALLIKLIAVAAVTPFFDPRNADRLADWAMLNDDDLKNQLDLVEDGKFFRDVGIRNFTEGDFFGWYVKEWSPTIAQTVRHVLEALSEFDPSAVEQAPERVRDLLKRLYHGLFPREVRHDLGEYYTPDWLAERLLMQLDGDLFGPRPQRMGLDKWRDFLRTIRQRLTTTRFLDPACGSGTFLVLIVRRLRQWARECGMEGRDDFRRALLSNVVGFDLNPLAVISARANFLLAIGDLLRPDDKPVELPVYLADSIVLPVEGGENNLFEAHEGVYRLPLRGVGKEFLVPVELAEGPRLNTLAHVLRHDLEAEADAPEFLRLCQSTFVLPARAWARCERHLRELYETLLELRREGRNGIWTDIVRNMFMPLFVEAADFVVGNPPWVNWESLPQNYRDRSRHLWEKYGLFVHRGMDTILGKGKKDVAALLTYVAADLYLKTGGKLGFLITQSMFKTSGAGQGFRRFQLGQGEHLQVVAVDDFSALQPFEGATNRTAAFVVQKGQSTRYPVQYSVWRKRGKASVPFTATLEEALPFLRMRPIYAEPVDAADRTSAWLSADRDALKALKKVLGPSDYHAHAGAYSGGANAVYWLQIVRHNPDGTVDVRNISEGAKRQIEVGEHTIEADLLYPLLRGRDVKKWSASPAPTARFLIVQDPQTRRGMPQEDLKARCPRTFAYLKRYESVLRDRAAFKRYFRDADAFYSMFNIGEYTFAPYKVVWAEVASRLLAAVVEPHGQRPIVPDHTVILVECASGDEAHYLCAVLNSSPADLAVQQYIVLHPDPHVLENVRIPQYDPADPLHQRLAELSQRAHGIAAELGGDLANIEREVEECAARVWGLTDQELAAIRRSLAANG